MGAIGPWQIVIILLLGLLLFGGGGKISSIMGDFAKGIKAFRKGLQDEDKADEAGAQTIEARADATVEAGEKQAEDAAR